jgi:uncharacterized membrane protein
LLSSLALAASPLTGAVVGAMPGSTRAVGVTECGIGEDFVAEVAALMKPGTSTLFVLDREGDLGAILEGIHGLGGKVLKTNVHLDRARLIQSTLTSGSASKDD